MEKAKILLLLLFMSGFFSLLSAQGSLIWGGVVPPAQDSHGLYGLCYNSTDNHIYYLNLYENNIYIATSDSFVTYIGSIPTPNNEVGFADIAYCNYDNTFWIVNKNTKIVYKINTSGTILNSFSSPASVYPAGITWDDNDRVLYISDRLTSPPQNVYVVDTLGNTIRVMQHPAQGYLGPRCLAFQPHATSPLLLNVYTFFTAASALDSACVYALDPQNCNIQSGFKFLCSTENNIRGIEYDPRDGSLWITNFSDG